MRMRLATYICAGVVAAMGIAAPMQAMAQSTEDLIVDQLFLKDADMLAATQMLTQKTGLRFIVEPSGDPFPKITLSLTKISAEDALAYICQSAGASYRRDANGVYIISRKREAPTTSVTPVENVAKPKITKKFKVVKADPRDVLSQIKFGKGFDATESFDKLRQEAAKFTSPNNVRSVGNGPILMGGPSYSTQNVPQVVNNGRANDIALPGEAANQGGAMGGGGGSLGGGFGQGGGGNLGGGLGQGGAGGAQLTAGQGLVGQSIDFISYDPTDNSIVVRGSEEDVADLQRYISMFDVAPKQVIIKVEFITTSSSMSRSLGFDWLYERGTIFTGNRPGSFARAGDPIFLSYASTKSGLVSVENFIRCASFFLQQKRITFRPITSPSTS